MIYQLYQSQSDMMMPLREFARYAADWLAQIGADGPARRLAASYEIASRLSLSHRRPPYGIDSVQIGNRDVAVVEEKADATPFCTLLHFRKIDAAPGAKVLLVAPLSGHFSTLLRDTARTMLPEHDVYLTDWHNVRDVATHHGRFGLDEYVDHLIRFLEKLGDRAHLVAICQPAVQALAATAIMAQDNNKLRPRSMSLMAGPIDTRINPTKVNEFAADHPIQWFELNAIGIVPFRYAGAFRRVYPGFMQIAGFMSMNFDRHLRSFLRLHDHLSKGETDRAETIETFYKEYFAVMDLPAEFYLETVQRIFQNHEVPLGRFTYRGRTVDPGAIRDTALLTIEGERDDICAVGQTFAAHDLCTGIPEDKKRAHVQADVGHYGVFAGRKWQNEVYPVLRDFISANGA
ncbi:MAG TPA: polyhydroxyalkanoate depolymerase [Stellaceae bacterium]|jgi:polyhydroxyalkanoate depolymerase